MIAPTDQYVADLDADYQERMEAADRAHTWANRAIHDAGDVCDILFDHGSEFACDVVRLMRNLPALRMGERIAYQATCEALTAIEGKLHAIAVKMAPED